MRIGFALLLCALPLHAALLLNWQFPASFTNTLQVPDASGNNCIGYAPTNVALTFTGAPSALCPSATNLSNGKSGAFARDHGTNEFYAIHHGQGCYADKFTYHLNDYLGMSNLTAFANLPSGTFACFVQCTQDEATNPSATIFNGGWGGYTNSIELSRFNSDGSSAFCFFVYTNLSDNTGRRVLVFPTLANGAILHYGVTWSAAANQVIGYTNGVPFATNTMGVPYYRLATPGSYACFFASTHGGPFHLDRSTDCDPSHGWLTGALADVRFYDTALTANEVNTLANGPPLRFQLTGTATASGHLTITTP